MSRSPVSPEHAGWPRLLDQLMVLPPPVRIVGGALMLVLGSIAIVIDVSFYSFVLLAIGTALGLPLLIHGVADRARRRREGAEYERAKAELSELRAAIAAAQADRQNIRRLLRQRGYTSDTVCRWIALECGIVLSRGGE